MTGYTNLKNDPMCEQLGKDYKRQMLSAHIAFENADALETSAGRLFFKGPAYWGLAIEAFLSSLAGKQSGVDTYHDAKATRTRSERLGCPSLTGRSPLF